MNAGDNNQITAYFDDRATAQNALDDLKAAGLSSSDLALHDRASGGGSFMDGLKNLFGGEASHEHYGGGTLLNVYGHGSIALPILQRYGARLESEEAFEGSNAETMKLREERLNVDKQAVKAGEVRLGKEVVTEQQRIDVPVSHEEVVVSRRAVTERESLDDIGKIGDDREIIVPVMREEVSVDKRAVVTEEIGLRKQTVQETETVSGSVRKERATLVTNGDIEDQVTERVR